MSIAWATRERDPLEVGAVQWAAKLSNPSPARQKLLNALEHAYRSTAPAPQAALSISRVAVVGDTLHDHLSALVGPDVAQRALASATCDMVWCAERKLQAGSSAATRSFFSTAPPRPPPAARRFQPVPEGRITAPVMGSFTAGAAPGFPRGRGFGWDRAKTPAYYYQVCSRRDALRSSPSSDTL